MLKGWLFMGRKLRRKILPQGDFPVDDVQDDISITLAMSGRGTRSGEYPFTNLV